MKTVKVYKQIENRLKILGLSYTGLKFFVGGPVFLFMILFFIGIFMSSVWIILIGLVIATLGYFVIQMLDSSRFIQRISDESIPKHIINTPRDNDQLS
jgi:uncharacterized membrane protein